MSTDALEDRAVKRPSVWIAALVFGLLVSFPTHAQSPHEKEMAIGRAALAAGRYEDALKHFRRGRRQAQRANDDAGEARLMFYQALSWQRRAQETSDSPRPMLKRAAKLYRKVLVSDEGAVSAAGNLARIYAQLGQNEEAEASFQRAIAGGDSRQAFYTVSYADFLASQGNWKRAASLYRMVVLTTPQSTDAHRKLLAHCLREDLTGLISYLRELLAHGQVVRAQESAILALEQGGANAEQLRELLELITVSLSQQLYDPANFRIEADPDRRLWEFRDDPVIGPGVHELFALHDGDGLVPARFPWWTGTRDLSLGISALEAFRGLARSLGERHQRVGRMDRAETMYKLATDLEPGAIDPLALRGLADLYLADGRREAVEHLATKYEARLELLMMGRDHDEQLFDYRRSLGKMFGHLEAWGDPSTIPSALYQLEKGREVATLIDSRRLPEGRLDFADVTATHNLLHAMSQTTGGAVLFAGFNPTFDASLAELLAKGYETTGHLEDSYRVRLETASTYTVVGKASTARSLLAPIEGSKIAVLDSDLDAAYTSLKSLLDPIFDVLRTAEVEDWSVSRARTAMPANRLLSPRSRQDVLESAVALDNAGRTAAAITYLNVEFTGKTGEAWAYYYLGLAQFTKGDSAKAKQHLERFLELAPDDPEAEMARGILAQLE